VFNETDYSNPFDAIDWRWLRVVSLCDAGEKPLKGTDDKYVFRAWRFLNDLRGIKSPLDTYSVTLKHKNVAEAFDWYNHRTQKRQFLEALLLCDDTSADDIAAYMGMTVPTLETYKKLFFDVEEHLYDKGYITTKILHPAIATELRDMAHPVYAWKILAVYGGASIVKSCWEYRDSGDDVNRFHYRSGFSQMMKNFGMANYFRPVNKFTANEITDNVMRMVEVEAKRAALEEGGTADEIESRAGIIKGILESVGFEMSDPDLDYEDKHVEGRIIDMKTRQPIAIDTDDTIA